MGVIYFIVGGIVGWVICYFVMKNNPKYFNLSKMGKIKLGELLAKVKEELKV